MPSENHYSAGFCRATGERLLREADEQMRSAMNLQYIAGKWLQMAEEQERNNEGM